MEEKRKAKRCPKCGTMTFVDRDQCQNCGRQFQTDVVAAPNAYSPGSSFNPERTQMLVLPPDFHRAVKPPDEAETRNRSTILSRSLRAVPPGFL